MTYQLGIDVDAVRAIDTHVHVEIGEDGHCALPQPVLDAASAYFKAPPKRAGLDEIADHYRNAGLAAVVFTVDAGTALGHPANSSEEIAEGAARNNDVLIPFGSVDPLTGAAAIGKARRLVGDHGRKGSLAGQRRRAHRDRREQSVQEPEAARDRTGALHHDHRAPADGAAAVDDDGRIQCGWWRR